MRFVDMAPWLRVAVVLAMAMCALLAVVGAEAESNKEFIAIHRTLPAQVYHHPHHHEEEDGKPKLQWRFNPFNPFQTFAVSKDGHGHGHGQKKCGKAAKLASWFPNVFGHPRYFGHDHHHHHHHHHVGEEEKVNGRPFLSFGRHHSWLPFRSDNHHHQHRHDHVEHEFLGEDREHQFKRHREGLWNNIKGSFSDMRDRIESWVMPARARKAPTLQSATEPLDMHTLQRHATHKSSCDLRERLSSVFTSILKEVAVNADKDTDKDALKSNLKRLMGDPMELAILKNVCDTSSMSPCEQDFCDVFLSHPQSGILMAFRILGINPIKAALTPESVSRNLPPFINRHEDFAMSPADSNLMAKFRQVRRLAHIVHANMERLSVENPQSMLTDLQHKLKKHLPEAFGGEMNPCKACLRQEIFQMKRLAKRALLAACEAPVDAILEQSCKFVKENKFVAKTMFAYKFKFWEKATWACNSKKDCHTLLPPALDQSGHHEHMSVLEIQEHQTHLPFLDVNSIRHPRQRALHRAALLRGHSLNLLASELMKVGDGLSQNGEIGAVLVFEISSQSQPLFEMGGSDLPTLTSVQLDEVLKTKPMHSEFIYGGEMQPFHGFLRKPVFDLNPVHEGFTEMLPVVGSQGVALEGPAPVEEKAPYTVDVSTVGTPHIVGESAGDTLHDSLKEGSSQHMDM